MIREMRQEDHDRVLDMMLTFYASDALLIHPPEAVLRKTLSDCLGDSPFVEGFVFQQGQDLAGYAMAAKSYSTEAGGPCVWIEDLYIRPEYRGMGLGSSFLRYARDRYREEAVRLRLEAEPENERAMEVYRKAGFQVLGYTQLVVELAQMP